MRNRVAVCGNLLKSQGMQENQQIDHRTIGQRLLFPILIRALQQTNRFSPPSSAAFLEFIAKHLVHPHRI